MRLVVNCTDISKADTLLLSFAARGWLGFPLSRGGRLFTTPCLVLEFPFQPGEDEIALLETMDGVIGVACHQQLKMSLLTPTEIIEQFAEEKQLEPLPQIPLHVH